MIFLYLPCLGLVHFLSAAALGFMSVLSGKALGDMRRQEETRRSRDCDPR